MTVSIDVSAETVVASISKMLDSLRGKVDENSIRNKVLLVRIAADVPYNLGDNATRDHAKASRKKALELFSKSGIPNELDGSALLYLSAGLVDLPIDQNRLVKYAADTSNRLEIRYVALDAVRKQSQLSSGIHDDLLVLAKDGWSYMDPGDVGPPSEAPIFPFRNLANSMLAQLEKQSQKNTEPRKNPGAGLPEEDEPKQAKQLMPPRSGTVNSVKKVKAETNPAVQAPSEKAATSAMWAVFVLCIVASLSLLWLLLKRRS